MKILHLDIETAPNVAHVWGLWNQNIATVQILDSGYTMCWSAKWQGQRKVFFDSLHNSKEEKMMKGIHRLLWDADVVVHYNGSKFDIPTINKEFVKLGIDPPAPYKQIDLLKVVKKNFKFPSNKLDYVAQALGLGAKDNRVSHETWKGCMEGDPKAWRLMERYNKKDVVLLEHLYDRLLPWISNHPNYGLHLESDRPVCPNCGSDKVHRRGYARTKTQLYHRLRCATCGTWSRTRFTEVPDNMREHILTQEV